LEILVFVEGKKLENPEKNPQSKARTNNKLNPHVKFALVGFLLKGVTGNQESILEFLTWNAT